MQVVYVFIYDFSEMGEVNESQISLGGMEKISPETNRRPRDFLRTLMAGNPAQLAARSISNKEESEEIELSLGLSLGGRYGVDKSAKKLTRSSSIAGFIPIARDDDMAAPPPPAFPTLIRTSSLPLETEEEWQKRKELQTLRRMEAKRRRSEKQRSLKSDKDGGGGAFSGGGGSEWSFEDERREIILNLRGRIQGEQYIVAANRMPTWAAAAPQAIVAAGKGNYLGGGGGSGGLPGFLWSSGSVESQGGSSSGVSESDGRPIQGTSSRGEASPASIQSLQDQSDQEAVGSGPKGREIASKFNARTESPSKRREVVGKRSREIGLNSMEDMPCVFTQGDGPNGRRVKGILYKYGKGEEVRIMCVCHGSFLSPAEFVKHAGSNDVANPLKHIVVSPPGSFE